MGSALVGDADELGDFGGLDTLDEGVGGKDCFGGVQCVERFDRNAAKSNIFKGF